MLWNGKSGIKLHTGDLGQLHSNTRITCCTSMYKAWYVIMEIQGTLQYRRTIQNRLQAVMFRPQRRRNGT